MKNFGSRFSFFLLITGMSVLFYFSGDYAAGILNKYSLNTRSFLFSKLSFFSSFVEQLNTLNSLIWENTDLKNENLRLVSSLAEQSNLKRDNDLLRQALNLPAFKDYKLTSAGVFNIEFGPEGHHLLVNRGLRDGVEQSDVLASFSGVLVGQISHVFENYSRADIITNPDMKIMARVISKNTRGIARGAMDDGLYLDFISQNDEIAENDIIVTSGDDLFPADLIIGKIYEIDSSGGSLFKKIKIRPTLKDIDISSSLILGK